MQINDRGLALIKKFEGCRLKAYQDIVGIWTIGYGHTGADVKDGLCITQKQADDLLRKDIEKFEVGVDSIITSPMSNNQFSALVSFAFNLGLGALRGSTLKTKVNAKDYAGAAQEFLKWCKAGGAVVPGLLARRQAEQALFLQA